MPNNKRAIVLMTVLLGVLACYVFVPRSWLGGEPAAQSTRPEPPLPGENTLQIQSVEQQKNGAYVAKIKYFYTGSPVNAYLRVNARSNQYPTPPNVGRATRMTRGGGTLDVELDYPFLMSSNPQIASVPDVVATDHVFAGMTAFAQELASTTHKVDIVWPSSRDYQEIRSLAGKTSKQLYDEAVTLIDDGSSASLQSAKRRIDVVLNANPRDVAAQIELARIALKQGRGPEAWYQAEQFLTSALAIDPRSANAKVLLGHVYTNQKKFADAERTFIEAEAIGTNNLWLWTNWGDLLERQNKSTGAVEKYLRAVAGERPRSTSDRAREVAYRRLLRFLSETKNVEQANDLHRKRVAEFAEEPCYIAKYSLFRTMFAADYKQGAELARDALGKGCNHASESLGIAHYYAWAELTGENAQTERTKARLQFAEGSKLIAGLANAESGMAVARKLQAGLSRDEASKQSSAALAIALFSQEIVAARRLLQFGARASATVEPDGHPIALIPLMNRDIAGIKLLRDHGVDYSRLKFSGRPVVEWAKESGDAELIKAMGLAGGRV